MILIIDSEKTPDTKIKQSFNELGLESVVIAKTAEKARQLLLSDEQSNGQDKISLIIISTTIEDANEFELCREIRKTDFGKNIYIVVLVSSAANKTAIENSKLSGASDFSVKPYNTPEFQQHILRFLRNQAVMLVEDDPVVRQMVRKILMMHQVEVIEVDDGLQAYNLLNTMPPVRMVLMDIGLPNMNGIQLVEHIRNKPGWKKTPVIMLTASSDSVDVKKCLTAGASDYITKPFNVSDFVGRLSRYLPDEN